MKKQSFQENSPPLTFFIDYSAGKFPELPKFATDGSACFDLAAFLIPNTMIEGYNAGCSRFERYVYKWIADENVESAGLVILPGETLKIPTGLILDIPTGYSVRVHIRSSVGYKLGLALANNEGIIDSDYVDPLFLLIHNRSNLTHWIANGQRLAQGELVENIRPRIVETSTRPSQKTNREGGIGSTGV